MRTKIVKLVVFGVVTMVMIAGLGNIFRDTGDISNRIYAFHQQPKNTIDVVLIGASPIPCGWSTVEAYQNFGFTSWGWATNSQPTSISAEYLIRDIQQTQSPKLYVIACNNFYSEIAAYNEGTIRHVTDNLTSISNRQKAIRALLPYRADHDVTEIYYTFPFLRFHGNWETYLQKGFPTRYDKNTMGTRIVRDTFTYSAISPQPYDHNASAPLSDLPAENLPKMLSWLKQHEIPVLFVLFPRESTLESTDGRYNTAEAMIKEYGFEYLNLAAIKDEIGLDVTKDFRDKTHLNYWGRTKTTNYLADYLRENYDLPDHRGDPAYDAPWNSAYEHYLTIADQYMAAEEEASANGAEAEDASSADEDSSVSPE